MTSLVPELPRVAFLAAHGTVSAVFAPLRFPRWFIALVVLGACGDTDDPDGLVRQVIGRTGGQVSSHDGALTLLFQPGALDENITVEITPSETPPASIGGLAYRVKPDLDLIVPIEVTYRGSIPADTASSTAAVGAIRRRDFLNGAGFWVPLTRTELDAAAGVVAGVDQELSLFYGLIQTSSMGGTTGGSDSGSGTATDDSTTTDPLSDSTSDGGSTGLTESDATTEASPAETGTGTTGTDSDVGVPLSHAVDIQPLWVANCMGGGCHSVGQTSPDLETDPYDALLTGNSLYANASFVTPGDPHASYVVHKLNGTHRTPQPIGCGCNGAGSPMPLGRDPLSAEQRALIAAWIMEGAEP